ncbi:hypothetical protein [Aquisediminimonas profunda]|nr:hypothetical protein [Aquisediminimonas profunda]
MPIWLRTASPALVALNGAQFLGRGRKLASHVEIEAFAFPGKH